MMAPTVIASLYGMNIGLPFQGHAHAFADADEGNAHGAHGGPGAAGEHGDHRAQQAGCGQEGGGGQPAEAVVDHGGNDAADHPCADDHADDEHDEKCGCRGLDGLAHAVFKFLPGEAAGNTDGGGHGGCNDERHVGRGAEQLDAAEDHREGEDEDANGRHKADLTFLFSECAHVGSSCNLFVHFPLYRISTTHR